MAKSTVNLYLRQFMKQLSVSQQQWISQGFSLIKYQALAGDAGFRRYFRLYTPEKTLMFMDASEELAIYQAFIRQTKHLSTANLPIPCLLAQNDEHSWAILEDFGDDLLWNIFQEPQQSLHVADTLYREAINHLILFHQHPVQAYGRYSILDENVMLEELHGWQEWCLQGLFHQNSSTELLNCFELIAKNVAHQPYVFIHRDFHSKNLLRKSNQGIGIIDYQDAMSGPISYDLVSLLRDCYVSWPEKNVIEWALYYKNMAQKANLLTVDISDENFLRWFDWTSIQRHLKALFTFSRKSLRDKNDNYLPFIPRTFAYLDEVSSKYPELITLTEIIRKLT